jgi:hypothetical protein
VHPPLSKGGFFSLWRKSRIFGDAQRIHIENTYIEEHNRQKIFKNEQLFAPAEVKEYKTTGRKLLVG